ncbi:Hypothetical protein PHPALM_16553 [Phytophthora palmivora]|uniref:Uncharacterized protein n=1 Tax=Phytophthora palmivora TaxID=4796 RepID=A0A2P4XPJ2_9STRA|nr:Hypothetical protein PHPALM_16553 [Phytophthora palmivora]
MVQTKKGSEKVGLHDLIEEIVASEKIGIVDDEIVAVLETIITIETLEIAALHHQRSANRGANRDANRGAKNVSLHAVRHDSPVTTERKVEVVDRIHQGVKNANLRAVQHDPVMRERTVEIVSGPRRDEKNVNFHVIHHEDPVTNEKKEEDDNDYHREKKDADPEESPREPVTSSTDPIDDDTSHNVLDHMNTERMTAAQPFKSKNSDYFDSDEEEHEPRAPSPIKHSVVRSDFKAPISSVTSDNNFVHDDWDAEDDEPSRPAPTSKISYPSAVGTGGVAADANFVHEDWDE